MAGTLRDKAAQILNESKTDTPETFISKVYSGLRADPLLISNVPITERLLRANGIVVAIIKEAGSNIPSTQEEKPEEEKEEKKDEGESKEEEEKEEKEISPTKKEEKAEETEEEKPSQAKEESPVKETEEIAPPRTIAFITKPTLSSKDAVVEAAKEKTESQTSLTRDAGLLNFTDEELQEFSTYHTFKKPLTGSEVTLAWQLYQSGVTGQQLSAALDNQSFLTDLEADSLDNITKLTDLLSLQDENLSADLVIANAAPELTIQDYSEIFIPPSPPGDYFLSQSGDQGLNPVLQTGIDFAQGKIEDFAKDALKKGAEKLVARGTQTAVTTTGEAAVSATGEAVTVGATETVVAGGTAAAGGGAAAVAGGGAAAAGGAAATGAAAGGAAVAGGAAATGAAVAGGTAAAGGASAVVAAEAAVPGVGWVAIAVEAVLAIVVAAGAIVIKGLQKLVTSVTGEADTRQSVMALSMVMLMSGIGLGSPLLIGVGGFGLTGSAFALAGGMGIATGVVGFFSAVMLGLALAVSTFVVPLVIAFIGVPLFIIFVVLIIYMGGYVVPPNPAVVTPYQQTSLYIRVEKTAESPGHAAAPRQTYDNSELPETVTFTVSITPLLGALTNIHFDSRCTVTNQSPPPPDCPPEQNITANGQPAAAFPPPAPAVISPSETYVITYTQNFSNQFVDSFVVDTFTVTADAPGVMATSAAASATLCIGDCPSECPSIYPTDHGYVTQGAYPSGSCGGYPCSHGSMEAIDIGVSGATVYATHAGVATYLQNDCLGNHVHIVSTCEGREFFSEYAHLESVDASVISGGAVSIGQVIGISGNTGYPNCSTGPHLHYRFKYTNGSNPSYPNNPPFMWNSITPSGFGGYFPRDVPRGCHDTGECGVSW